MHGGQGDPGNIDGAYYLENDKGKVIVINDYTTERHGGGRGSSSRTVHSSWLISLDAVTGKEIKRLHTNHIEYFGRDKGNIWLISSDTNIIMHSRDPFTLEVIEGSKSIIAKVEDKYPLIKGKIASSRPDKYSGNLLITTFDASKYYINPITFEATDYTNEKRDFDMKNGLENVGAREYNVGDYMAYKDGEDGKNIYQLIGDDAKQLYHLDKYKWDRRDHPGGGPPMFVTKKHIVLEQKFIEGYFVHDAFTRRPLCFNDGSLFIYHFDRMGKGQKNMLTHVDSSGTIKSQYDITQTDPKDLMKEAFVADNKLYLVFADGIQCRDISGKLLWQYNEDTMTH